MTESTTVAKLKAMQSIVLHLRMGGENHEERAFEEAPRLVPLIPTVETRKAVNEYLDDRGTKSRLFKIAFPDANHWGVELAFAAGSTLEALYRLACGTPFYVNNTAIPPHLLRGKDGKPLKAKHGLKIVWREAVLPKKQKNETVEFFRSTSRKRVTSSGA